MPQGVGYNPYTMPFQGISLGGPAGPDPLFNPYPRFSYFGENTNPLFNRIGDRAYNQNNPGVKFTPDATNGRPPVQAGQAIAGGLGFASSMFDIFQHNTTPLVQAPMIDRDDPTLDAGFYNTNMAVHSDAAAKAEGNKGIGKGVLSGASAGAALGPLGAIGGAIIGGVAGLFGKKKRKKKAKEARDRAQDQFNSYISNFNKAKSADLASDAARERNMRNIYQGFPSSTYSLI